MSFEELEIKATGMILKFSQIEQDKQKILKDLKSGKSSIFEELKKLSVLLTDEISLIKIILKELEFIDEHKRGLKRLALRKSHNEFYWKILERTDKLRTAVLRFFDRAESDAKLTERILVAWEDPKDKSASPLLEVLLSSLNKDIELEEKLEEAEAYHILDDYLKFAESNIQDPKLKDTVIIAFRRTNLAKIAACFLVAFMSLGSLQKAYADEQNPATGVQRQLEIRFPLRTDNYRISTRFGPRIHPITNKQDFHKGIDLAAQLGTPVTPIMAGKVVSVGHDNLRGNAVTIDHGNGYVSIYIHLDKVLVPKGIDVFPQTGIGTVGSTGRSTGNHLHLTILLNGQPVDPLPLILPNQR